MRDYAKVSPQFWTGDTSKSLRSAGRDAQIVAFYLMTCPSANMLGLFYLPIPTLCHEVGIPSKGASEALRRVSEAGFAHYDAATETVWVVEMARFQVEETLAPNDNRIKGIVRELAAHRKCKFARHFYEKYRGQFNLPALSWWGDDGDPLPSPFGGAPEPLRSQEKEQKYEQKYEQKQEQDTSSGAAAPSVGSLPLDDDGFVRFWTAYPRKIAKADAAKAWGKLRPNAELQHVIVAAIEAQRTWPTWPKDSKYVPYPATWLNKRRWEDPPAEPAPSSATAPAPTGRNGSGPSYPNWDKAFAEIDSRAEAEQVGPSA